LSHSLSPLFLRTGAGLMRNPGCFGSLLS